METKGNTQIIRALVPMSEMLNYQNDLISMTQGRASYAMEFDHYDFVPGLQADKVIAAAKAAKAGVEEEENRRIFPTSGLPDDTAGTQSTAHVQAESLSARNLHAALRRSLERPAHTESKINGGLPRLVLARVAAQDSDRNVWLKALSKLIPPASKDTMGEVNRSPATALHLVARHSELQSVAELLLNNGADVNAKGDYGYTPLHLAAEEGAKGVVELLLARGADVNAKTDRRDDAITLGFDIFLGIYIRPRHEGRSWDAVGPKGQCQREGHRRRHTFAFCGFSRE